jgi:hypothetical protein
MRRIGSNHHRRHSASRGNARRDGAEVSSGHSSVSASSREWPNMKGQTCGAGRSNGQLATRQ